LNFFAINFSNILIKAIVRGYGSKIMKRIEAIVAAHKADSTTSALMGMGLGGLTVYNSKGKGSMERPMVASGRASHAFRAEYNSNATIVTIVKDSMVDKVVQKILETASTGLAGEGKIFISDVIDTVDIGTKQRGESTI
jgi:nitrogen regulatory protein P-II 1